MFHFFKKPFVFLVFSLLPVVMTEVYASKGQKNKFDEQSDGKQYKKQKFDDKDKKDKAVDQFDFKAAMDAAIAASQQEQEQKAKGLQLDFAAQMQMAIELSQREELINRLKAYDTDKIKQDFPGYYQALDQKKLCTYGRMIDFVRGIEMNENLLGNDQWWITVKQWIMTQKGSQDGAFADGILRRMRFLKWNNDQKVEFYKTLNRAKCDKTLSKLYHRLPTDGSENYAFTVAKYDLLQSGEQKLVLDYNIRTIDVVLALENDDKKFEQDEKWEETKILWEKIKNPLQELAPEILASAYAKKWNTWDWGTIRKERLEYLLKRNCLKTIKLVYENKELSFEGKKALFELLPQEWQEKILLPLKEEPKKEEPKWKKRFDEAAAVDYAKVDLSELKLTSEDVEGFFALIPEEKLVDIRELNLAKNSLAIFAFTAKTAQIQRIILADNKDLKEIRFEQKDDDMGFDFETKASIDLTKTSLFEDLSKRSLSNFAIVKQLQGRGYKVETGFVVEDECAVCMVQQPCLFKLCCGERICYACYGKHDLRRCQNYVEGMKKIFQKAVGDNPGLIEQYAKGLEQAKVEPIHVPCELCMLVKCTTCGSEEPKGYLKLF